MRRSLSVAIVYLVALTVAAPAVWAREEATATSAPTAGAPAVSVTPSGPSLGESIQRVAFEMADANERATATRSAAAAPATSKRAKARATSAALRRQGGGSGAMIIGLVSTVAGIAGTIYMVKYLRDQQKKTDQ